jgi:hypothetical protein
LKHKVKWLDKIEAQALSKALYKLFNMAKKKGEAGLTKKQIMGLILIFIFIVSILAFGAIQSGF